MLDGWISIRESYWFIPTLMAAAALGLSFLTVFIDTQLGDDWWNALPLLTANQPAGARALLSTVAGSMITVAGVTFSMTLLAVSHASAQIGPRLLVGFMRDRGNQLTLGTFIATFLYCLMVLRTVQSPADGASEHSAAMFVPHLAVLVAVALAILSVMVLIYFIHHVPQSISVGNVVGRVGDQLIAEARSLYPNQLGEAQEPDLAEHKKLECFQQSCDEITVDGAGGYLRIVDTEGLLRLATEREWMCELLLRPGSFVVTGQPLLRVWRATESCGDISTELQALFSYGTERTHEQDLMFPAEQLIEVLGKAMSPGINGQYTAVLCLNQFERAFAELLQRQVPSAYRFDEHEKLRIIAQPITHAAFIVSVLDPVRQFIRGDWIATNELLRMLGRLLVMPGLQSSRPLLCAERDKIRQDVAGGTLPVSEKNALLSIGELQ